MAAEEAFWRWFSENESELLEVSTSEPEQKERTFERLEAELHEVDAQLTFEFGSGPGRRDFVISADGKRDAFPAVIRLCQAAPELPLWNVIAFRPRRGEHGTIEMDDVVVKGADLTFTLLDDASTTGLRLFIPGYTDKNATFKAVGYLFLDEALGEYDVETGLSLIHFHSPEEITEGQRYRFSELPVLFDQLRTKLRGASGKPN